MRRYLITGATSGVGYAVADKLRLHNDCELVIVGRDEQRLRTVAPGSLRVRRELVDLVGVEPYGLSQAIRTWAADLPFDGIFHAAGEETVLPLRMMDDARYRRTMTFADSTFAILRAAVTRGVMRDSGSIVIMSSVAAHRGTAGMAAYSAARAAAEAMVRVAAAELAPRGIRVNALAAGAFASPMHERLMQRQPEEARAAYARKHPLGIGQVDAVRDAVLHLLGPQSAWTTGAVMVVDGGYLAA